jgi:hypothetical protein
MKQGALADDSATSTHDDIKYGQGTLADDSDRHIMTT